MSDLNLKYIITLEFNAFVSNTHFYINIKIYNKEFAA